MAGEVAGKPQVGTTKVILASPQTGWQPVYSLVVANALRLQKGP